MRNCLKKNLNESKLLLPMFNYFDGFPVLIIVGTVFCVVFLFRGEGLLWAVKCGMLALIVLLLLNSCVFFLSKIIEFGLHISI